MLCQICPRCQFRLAPGKHICSTCGNSLAVKRDAKESVAPRPAEATGAPLPKTVGATKKSFWKSLFTVADEPATQDPRHDEPALET